MKTTTKFILVIMIALLTNNVRAKEANDSIIHPLQISFITSIGTNGNQSWDITYHIKDNKSSINNLSFLNKLNLDISREISDKITFFGGLSWNVLGSDVTYNENVSTTACIVPYNVYCKTKNDFNIEMYPGFTFGIRL